MNRKKIQSTALSLLVPLLLLILALLIVVTKVERPSALIQTGVEWMEVGTLAMAMTAIIITGGIVCLLPPWLHFVLSPPAYYLISLNGPSQPLQWQFWSELWLVYKRICNLRLSPLIVTLATMAVFSGLALSITPEAGIQMPIALEEAIYFGRWPAQYFGFASIFCIAMVGLHRTRYGRTCFYLGENPVAARYVALPVNQVLFGVYVMSGLLAGVVAVMYVMSRTTAIAIAHQGAELKVIACVVVGGTLITGGHGSIGRTLLGLCVMASLDISLDLMANDYLWMDAQVKIIVMGVLVVAIAVWNQWLAKRLN